MRLDPNLVLAAILAAGSVAAQIPGTTSEPEFVEDDAPECSGIYGAGTSYNSQTDTRQYYIITCGMIETVQDLIGMGALDREELGREQALLLEQIDNGFVMQERARQGIASYRESLDWLRQNRAELLAGQKSDSVSADEIVRHNSDVTRTLANMARESDSIQQAIDELAARQQLLEDSKQSDKDLLEGATTVIIALENEKRELISIRNELESLRIG